MKPLRLFFLLCGIAALASLLFFFLGPIRGDAYAREIVEKCRDANYRPLCYEKEVPRLMDRGLSMEEAFDVTAEVQRLDPSYVYCHVLAHNISAKETAKDLSKWKEVVARAPSGVCGNGGLHGAFQERFRTDALPDANVEDLMRELSGACDAREGWDPTHLERASCMHGVGHLAMYVTAANVEKSLALCELLARPTDEGDFRRTCMDGVFMQIYQPLEPEDVALVEALYDESRMRKSFCKRFTNHAHTSCIKESWPLFEAELATPQGLMDVCAPLTNAEDYEYCISGTIFVVFGRMEYDVGKMQKLCAALSGSAQDICTARTAVRFVETDWKNIQQALAVCAAARSQDACYRDLVTFVEQGLQRGSHEAEELCNGMPEMWKARCENILRT